MNGKQPDEQYLADVVEIAEWYRGEYDKLIAEINGTGMHRRSAWTVLGREIGQKLTEAHNAFLDRVAEKV